jgi:hypothetical protein
LLQGLVKFYANVLFALNKGIKGNEKQNSLPDLAVQLTVMTRQMAGLSGDITRSAVYKPKQTLVL